MRSRLFTILLLIALAAPAANGFTPLTLGAAPGATNGWATPDQAFGLAATLATALGEVVEVRLFAAQEEISQWLNQSEAPALGVFDDEFLTAHPDEFLLLGAADPGGRVQVVTRRGVAGDLPQRVAAALKSAGPLSPAGPDWQQSGSSGPLQATVTSFATLPPEPAAPLLASAPGPTAQPAAAPVGPMPPSKASLPTALDEAPAPVVIAPPLPQPTSMPPPVEQDFQVPRSVGPIQTVVPLLATAPPTPPALVLESAPGLRALPTAAAPAVPMPTGAAPPPAVSEPPAPVVLEPPLPITAPPAVSPPGGEPPATAAEAPPVAPQASGETPSPPPSQATSPAEPPIPASIASPAVTESAVLGVPLTPAPGAQAPLLTAVVEPQEPSAVAAPVVPEPTPSAISTPGGVGPGTLPAEAAAAPLLPALGTQAPLLTAVVEPVTPLTAIEPTAPAPAAIPPPAGELPLTPPAETETAPSQPEPPVAPQDQGAALPVLPPAVASPLAEAEAAAPVPAATQAEAEVDQALVSTSPVPVAEAPLPTAVIEPLAPVAVYEPPPPAAAAELLPPAAEEPFAEIAISSAVPEMIAQPDLPQELRPPAVPLPRPAKRPAAAPELTDEPSIVGKFEQLVTRAPKPAPLLAAPDPDPGVIYLIPFVTLMVPPEVHERVFDQFVDTLNQQGTEQRLKFVILKQALNKVDQNWLASRKHVLGEIFGYVEDSGCCSTTIRANVRLLYYRAHQPEPTLRYDYPVQVFFDHDRSNLPVERQKLADQIVTALVNQLFKALQP